MIPIEKLKDYAKKLEFTMEESEYTTLQSEFEILLKQVDKISEIESWFMISLIDSCLSFTLKLPSSSFESILLSVVGKSLAKCSI